VFTRHKVLPAAAVLFASLCAFSQSARPANAPAPEARVDINHATISELARVPGMTQIWAERIVRFRPYRAKNELAERGVVTGEVYARIKDYIVAHREKE
jgi:competence protein ComEA